MSRTLATPPAAKSRWMRHDIIRPDGRWVCRVMGAVEGWVVARYKGAAPFLIHVNEWEKRFKPAPDQKAGRPEESDG